MSKLTATVGRKNSLPAGRNLQRILAQGGVAIRRDQLEQGNFTYRRAQIKT